MLPASSEHHAVSVDRVPFERNASCILGLAAELFLSPTFTKHSLLVTPLFTAGDIAAASTFCKQVKTRLPDIGVLQQRCSMSYA